MSSERPLQNETLVGCNEFCMLEGALRDLLRDGAEVNLSVAGQIHEAVAETPCRYVKTGVCRAAEVLLKQDVISQEES